MMNAANSLCFLYFFITRRESMRRITGIINNKGEPLNMENMGDISNKLKRESEPSAWLYLASGYARTRAEIKHIK